MPFLRTTHSTITCATFLGFLWAAGCAQHRGAAPAPTEAQLCAALKDIVAQSGVRFQKFKMTPTIAPFSGMTKWETTAVFPESQCDVLEWVGGRTNYVCTWPEGVETAARDTQIKTSARIGACLGPEWSRSDTRGQTGGATVFTRPKTTAQIVMRYFRPRSASDSSWETSLTIGDEVTTDPR